MDQPTQQQVYAIVAALAGVALESVTPEYDITGMDFPQIERQLQAALNLEIPPAYIEGSKTVADLCEKLDEILYC